MVSFLDALLPPFKRHLAYAKFFKCLPYGWSEKRKKFIVNQNPSSRVYVGTWKLITGAYIGFQIVIINHGEHALAERLVAALILAVYGCSFAMRLESEPDTEPIGNLNRLLEAKGKSRIRIMLVSTKKSF